VVDNVAPVITSLTNNAINAGSVLAGGTVTVTGTFTDPGVLDTHVLLVDWGDTSQQTTIAVTPGMLNFSINHVFAAVGDFYITVQVEDNDGGLSQVGLTEAIVGSPPPITFPPAPTPIVLGSPAPIVLASAPTTLVSAPAVVLAAPLSLSPAPVFTVGYVSASSASPAAGSPWDMAPGISLQPDVFSSLAAPNADPSEMISLVRGSSIVLATRYEPPAAAVEPAAPLLFDEDGAEVTDGSVWGAGFDLSPLVLDDTGEPWAILPMAPDPAARTET
jgi:hypothetical protein